VVRHRIAVWATLNLRFSFICLCADSTAMATSMAMATGGDCHDNSLADYGTQRSVERMV